MKEKIIRDLDWLYPPFREKVVNAISYANSYTIGKKLTEGVWKEWREWVVYETYRTPERQAWLYAKGRTLPGAIVTYTKNSRHTSGLAVDVVWKDVRGRYRWDGDESLWAVLGHAVRYYGLRWGGDWEQKDLSHIEANHLDWLRWALPAKKFIQSKQAK